MDKVSAVRFTCHMATTSWTPQYIDPLAGDVYDSSHEKLRDLIGALPLSKPTPDVWANDPDRTTRREAYSNVADHSTSRQDYA